MRLSGALIRLAERRRIARAGGSRAHRVAMRWLRRPVLRSGDQVCIFAMLPRDGRVLPHSADLIAAWRKAGYKIVVIAVASSIDAQLALPALGPDDGFAIRLNQGYDFGAWAAAIRALGRPLREAAVLALANDSVLGPSAEFAAMLERAERSPADLIGLVENMQVRRHLQSFLLFFKPRALRSRAFARFWGSVRSGERQYVIDQYETMLLERFLAAGLRAQSLFACDPDAQDNPTLARWRALLAEGFPFIKVQLLRDNPAAVPLADWRTVARKAGFDLDALDLQVAALKEHGAGTWQV